MYSKAIYVKSSTTVQNVGITAEINGVTSFVPIDEANTDYAAIMVLVAEGKLVIAPPETP